MPPPSGPASKSAAADTSTEARHAAAHDPVLSASWKLGRPKCVLQPLPPPSAPVFWMPSFHTVSVHAVPDGERSVPPTPRTVGAEAGKLGPVPSSPWSS
jgi:hypothetical protein